MEVRDTYARMITFQEGQGMINSVISITQDSLVTVAKDPQGFRGGIALTDRGGKNHRLDTVGDRVGYGLKRE